MIEGSQSWKKTSENVTFNAAGQGHVKTASLEKTVAPMEAQGGPAAQDEGL